MEDAFRRPFDFCLVSFLPGPARPFSFRLELFFLAVVDERGIDESANEPGPSPFGARKPTTWDQARSKRTKADLLKKKREEMERRKKERGGVKGGIEETLEGGRPRKEEKKGKTRRLDIGGKRPRYRYKSGIYKGLLTVPSEEEEEKKKI